MAQTVQERYETVILVRPQQAEDQAQRQYNFQHTQYKVGDCRNPVTHIGTTLISIFIDLHTTLDPVARGVYIVFALALRVRTTGIGRPDNIVARSIRPPISGRNLFRRLIIPLISLHSWIRSIIHLSFLLTGQFLVMT